MDDLISRQGTCDSLNKYRIEKMLEGKDVSLVWECIDKVLQEPSAQPDLSEYSDRLWRNAYERGKKEGQSEIVRCRECKFWEKKEDSSLGYCNAVKHCHFSDHLEIQIYSRYEPDFFCADGKRRDKDD